MPTEIPLKCRCGAMTGVATNVKELYRIVCYCRWCQAYAKHLGREDELLDAQQGTHVYQFAPSQIRLLTGQEHLRCLRLTAKGAMRFHAQCCQTPIANTVEQAWVPWLGMPHLFLDGEREPGFGPVRYRVHGRHAKDPHPAAHPKGSASLVLKTLAGMSLDYLRGNAWPSPFFDRASKKPVVDPRILRDDERAAIGLR
ncbi:MAG: DUF6151 family protein [Deltaproteobacteria bacterium]|nr:DUF6151 family protein [Deltaproteobacteria bacterium]